MLKKTLTWFLIVIAGLFTLALLILFYLNTTTGREWVIGKIEAQVGLPVQINGGLAISSEILGLQAKGVVVSAAQGQDFLFIDHMEFGLNQWTRTSSQQWILTARGVAVDVESLPQQSGKEEFQFELPAINARADIEDFRVLSQGQVMAGLDALHIVSQDSRKISIVSMGAVAEFPYQARLQLMATDGPGAHVDGAFSYRGFEILLNGPVADYRKLKGIDLKLSARKQENAGKLSVSTQGRLAGRRGDWRFDVEKFVLKATSGQIEGSTVLTRKNHEDIKVRDTKLRINSSQAGLLLAELGLEPVVSGKLNAQLSAAGSMQDLVISDLKLDLGDQNILMSGTGNARLTESQQSAMLQLAGSYSDLPKVVEQASGLPGAEGEGNWAAKVNYSSGTISVPEFRTSVDEGDRMLNLSGSFSDVSSLHGARFDLTASYPSDARQVLVRGWKLDVETANEVGQPAKFTGTVNLNGGDLMFSGSVRDIESLKGILAEFSYQPALANVSSDDDFGLVKSVLPRRYQGRFESEELARGFFVDAESEGGDGTLIYQGQYNPDDSSQGNGQLNLSGIDLNALLRNTGIDHEFPYPGDFSALIEYGPSTFKLSDFNLAIRDTRVKGWLEFSEDQGQSGSLRARLKSSHLEFADFGLTGSSGDQYFDDDRLNLASLQKLNLDVELEAGEVVTPALNYQNHRLVAKSSAGHLHILANQQLLGGGNSELTVDIDARSEPPLVAVNASMSNMNPAELRALQQTDGQFSGDVDVQFNVAGSGDSVRQVLSTADGYFLFRVNQAVVADRRLHLLSADFFLSVFRLLNPFHKRADHIEVECGLVAFRIDDGIARADRSIVVSGKKLFLQGGGVIDLATERVKLTLKPKANQGVGIGASTLINSLDIVGTLSVPEVKTDSKNLLVSGASIGAAMASGGMSLFFQGIFNRLTSGHKECQKTEDRFWQGGVAEPYYAPQSSQQ